MALPGGSGRRNQGVIWMPKTKIGLRPEDEHANGFAFTYTDRHGKITGRVSVRFSGETTSAAARSSVALE